MKSHLSKSLTGAKEQFKASIIALYAGIVDLLKKNGGFLNLSDFMGKGTAVRLRDAVFGYAYGGGEDVAEFYIMGIRLCGEQIQVVKKPCTDKYPEPQTDDELKSAEWESIDSGDFVKFQTLWNIAESIEQYLHGVNTDKGYVTPGTKIRIIHLDNGDSKIDDSGYDGKEGIVEFIDDIDGFHGSWGGLAVYPTDSFEIIG